jgi:hypothetical protein
MRKLKPPRLVTVAIFSTVTIIFWVFYSFYDLLTSTPDTKIPPEILSPISPILDTDILDNLQGRVFFNKGETTVSLAVQQTPTPTPQAEIETIPTPTPTLTAQP